MHYSIRFFLLMFFVLKMGVAISQKPQNTPPPSIVSVLPPNIADLQAEDRAKGWANVRCAANVPTQISHRQGVWRVLDDGRFQLVLRIQAADAKGLALKFKVNKMPLHANFFIENSQSKRQNLVERTNFSNFQTNILGGGVLDVVVELSAVAGQTIADVAALVDFEIQNVYYVYQNIGTNLSGDDFGSSLSCEVNINCPQGAAYQNQKRGVTRILMNFREGLGWCSGSLVNNTRRDGTPYLLTAYHCADGFTPNYDLWTFYFNYESPTCAGTTSEPALQSLQGCQLRAGRQQSDFLLLEIGQRIPQSFNAFFNGWSLDSNNAPFSSLLIHHPQGDIKKITFDYRQSLVYSQAQAWSNGVTTPAFHHLRIVPNAGAIEAGSSGSPLFDPFGRIVGQLQGAGFSDPCIALWALCGRFAKSWTGGGATTNSLKTWLDPLNQQPVDFDGLNNPTANFGAISGMIRTVNGRGVANVWVKIGADSVRTSATGSFSFSSVALNTNVTVSVQKNADDSENGSEISDALRLLRHVLGIQPFSSVFDYRAADVNGDDDANVADLLQMRRLSVGYLTQFTAARWKFIPQSVALNLNTPFTLATSNTFTTNFSATTTNFDFTAVKTGDLNNSVDVLR